MRSDTRDVDVVCMLMSTARSRLPDLTDRSAVLVSGLATASVARLFRMPGDRGDVGGSDVLGELVVGEEACD